MKFIRRWLRGSSPDNASGRLAGAGDRLQIEEYSERVITIPALDFIGQSALSPGRRFRIAWRDGNDAGTVGGYRTRGPGKVLLLDGGRLLTEVRAERPNDCKVADDGRFVVNDWRFGDGLKGRFLAYRSDGSEILRLEVAANLINNGLSPDGRLAVFQTANAPGEDACKLFLLDLDSGALLARFEPEPLWIESYGFAPEGAWIELRFDNGTSLRYGRDGAMLDREAWLAGRVGRGDVRVIQQLLKEKRLGLGPADAEPLLAGLDAAIAGDDDRARARAHRYKGEIFERLGRAEDALRAYEEALILDPQVGAHRSAEKLRKGLGAGRPARTPRAGRFKRHALTLGVGHEKIALWKGGPKQWSCEPREAFCSVEQAALRHFQRLGWKGAASEGGLVLTLIKAASFERLSPRHADTFIEALYAQNVAFKEDRFTTEALVGAVEKATLEQIERNWRLIAGTAGGTPAYYPAVRWQHVRGLFEALGTIRLASIARAFASAPYDFRAGWPDLTLWRGSDVRFVEVKAPGDQLHASQSRLIGSLLVPLGYNVSIAEVTVAP